MSDADAYARLMATFDALEAASPGERAAELAALEAREPTLARAVAELLAASGGDSAPFEALLDLTGAFGSDSLAGALSGERILPLPLGARVGLYRLTKVIGHGGMGCVYRAEHTELGRPVAIKVLDPRLSEDAGYVARFLREARTVSALRHPNVVDVFDFLETDAPRRVTFVMELLGGTTLRELLRERALGVEETLAAGLQLCSALEAVHAAGVVHRDLKPENVMVVGPLRRDSAAPSVKLLDFGIAKVPDPEAMHQTAAGVMMGTPAYMAPEQFAAEPAPAATDVYALGELLYEMLTQEPPFPGRGLRLMRAKTSGVPPTLALPSEVAAGALGRLLADCLRTDPAGRPSVPEVRAALLELGPEASAADAVPVVTLAEAPSPPRRRRGTLALASGLALSLALFVMWPRDGAPAEEPREASAPTDAPRAYATDPAEAETPAPVVSDDAAPTPAAPVVPEALRAELPAVLYGEADAMNTPFVASGFMGDASALEVDERWTENPRSGPTCFRVAYGPARGWAGIAWLAPADDWGELPGGLALDAATELSFWARSDREGLTLKVGYGVLLRDVEYFDT
ncbi:MAG: protein kinase, partial [Myxococcota bacterium]